MTDTLVSVLMPTAGRSPFLRAALASLAAQDHHRWELVVVLDGDDPGAVETELAEVTGHEVRLVVTGARRGVAAALNVGLAHARGEVVARLDDDDECEPQRLRRQVEELDRRPGLAVLGSAARTIDASGTVLGEVAVASGAALDRRLSRQNGVIHPSVAFRAEVVRDVGGYPVDLHRVEDYALWLALLGRHEIDNVAEPLVRRRVHLGQHSRGLPRATDLARIAGLQQQAGRRLGRGRLATAAGTGWWLGAQLTGVVRYRVPRR